LAKARTATGNLEFVSQWAQATKILKTGPIVYKKQKIQAHGLYFCRNPEHIHENANFFEKPVILKL
jgi:hypothetical protein